VRVAATAEELELALEKLGHDVVSDGPFDALVHVVSTSSPRSFMDLTEDDWDAAWERPMAAALDACRRAFEADCRRMVFVVPVVALYGEAGRVAETTLAEGVRLLAKSAARQWGPEGISVNVIALGTSDSPPTLAPPALSSRNLSPVLAMVLGESADVIAGATLVVDGGVWMAP
jgi:3-oxoacyl-[acyl-carrier protein] reductase